MGARRRAWWVWGLGACVLAGLLLLHFGIPDLWGEHSVERSIASRVLGEARTYFVHLPPSYQVDPTRRYPVVYVLDGVDQSGHTARAASVLASSRGFAEAIVVGIANTGTTGRNRDLTPTGMRQDEDAGTATGQSARFLRFLRTELLPAVEQEFRGSGRRVLAGNSRGGLFVVDAMAREPGLFDAYLANSPAMWREHGRPVEALRAFTRAQPAPRACLYLSIGADENAKMRGAFEAATQALRAQPNPGLRWQAAITPGADHHDNAERATPRALAWIAAHCQRFGG